MENPQDECKYRKLKLIGSNVSDKIIKVEDRENGHVSVIKSLGSDFTGPLNPIEIMVSTSIKSNRMANSLDVINGRICDLSGVALVNMEAETDMHDYTTDSNRLVSYEERLRLVHDTLQGVKTMHDRGYMHLDIKMENVLVKDGRGYLTDFGFSRKSINDDDRIYIGRDRGANGTKVFMAPELINCKNPRFYSYATDIWAVGHLIYAVITGDYLFDSRLLNHRLTNKQLNDGLLTYLYELRPDIKIVDRYRFDESIPTKDAMNLVLILEQCMNLDPTKRGSIDTILSYDIFNRFRDDTLTYSQGPLAFRIVDNPINYDENLRSISYLIVNNFGDEPCYLLFLAIDLFHRCVQYTGYNRISMARLQLVCVWIALKCIKTRHVSTLTQLVQYYGDKPQNAQNYARIETNVYVTLRGNISPNYLYEACTYGEQLLILYRDVILSTRNYGYNVDQYNIEDMVINDRNIGKNLRCSQFSRL